MAKRTRISICPEGWYYLLVLGFVFGGAFLREINLLLMMAGMMFGPLVLSLFAMRRALGGIEVRRELPEMVRAGELFVVDVTVRETESSVGWTGRRRKRASRAVVVEDSIRNEDPSDRKGQSKVGVLFGCIAPGQTSRQSYRGRLMQRGRYQFGPLCVSTRFPLGLLRRTVVLDQFDPLIVCPHLGKLTRRWQSVLHEIRLGSNTAQSKRGHQTGDFYGLRDWREGDSQHWIHWRSSARRGCLLVRQFEQPRDQDLILLLDLWQPEAPQPRHQENVELAVSFAATIVDNYYSRGDSRIVLAIAGQDLTLKDGQASGLLLYDVMQQQLATAQAYSTAPAESDERLLQLIACGSQHDHGGMNVLLISTREVNRIDLERITDAPAGVGNGNGQAGAMIDKILCFNTDSDELSEYFQVE